MFFLNLKSDYYQYKQNQNMPIQDKNSQYNISNFFQASYFFFKKIGSLHSLSKQ